MLHNLENMVTRNARNPFKSEGEKRVAATLEKYGIRYEYDRPVWVDDGSKVRRLRPDFYLPDFNLFIEYYGRVGNQDYDKRTEAKQRAYAASNYHVIPVYPWTLLENWPDHLLRELKNDNYHRTPSRSQYALPRFAPRYPGRSCYRSRAQPKYRR